MIRRCRKEYDLRDMIQLPSSFAEKMKELLGGEYEAYLKSCGGRAPQRPFGPTRWKIPPDELEEKLPFGVKRVPWIPNGFTYGEEAQPPGTPIILQAFIISRSPAP